MATSTNLPGDFNNDCVVDLADYTIWRDNLGLSSSALNGNGTGEVIVVPDDYNLWLSNFGAKCPKEDPTSCEGEWKVVSISDGTCADIDCVEEVALGACCVDDDCHDDWTKTDCSNVGGRWRGGVKCRSGLCDERCSHALPACINIVVENTLGMSDFRDDWPTRNCVKHSLCTNPDWHEETLENLGKPGRLYYEKKGDCYYKAWGWLCGDEGNPRHRIEVEIRDGEIVKIKNAACLSLAGIYGKRFEGYRIYAVSDLNCGCCSAVRYKCGSVWGAWNAYGVCCGKEGQNTCRGNPSHPVKKSGRLQLQIEKEWGSDYGWKSPCKKEEAWAKMEEMEEEAKQEALDDLKEVCENCNATFVEHPGTCDEGPAPTPPEPPPPEPTPPGPTPPPPTPPETGCCCMDQGNGSWSKASGYTEEECAGSANTTKWFVGSCEGVECEPEDPEPDPDPEIDCSEHTCVWQFSPWPMDPYVEGGFEKTKECPDGCKCPQATGEPFGDGTVTFTCTEEDTTPITEGTYNCEKTGVGDEESYSCVGVNDTTGTYETIEDCKAACGFSYECVDDTACGQKVGIADVGSMWSRTYATLKACNEHCKFDDSTCSLHSITWICEGNLGREGGTFVPVKYTPGFWYTNCEGGDVLCDECPEGCSMTITDWDGNVYTTLTGVACGKGSNWPQFPPNQGFSSIQSAFCSTPVIE